MTKVGYAFQLTAHSSKGGYFPLPGCPLCADVARLSSPSQHRRPLLPNHQLLEPYKHEVVSNVSSSMQVQ